MHLELFDGNNIRGGFSETGEKIFSIHDFMNVVCAKKQDDSYGRVTYARLCKTNKKPAIKAFFEKHQQYSLKLKGRGPRDTPAMTALALQDLLMLLGDKVAEAFKEKTLKILQRYLDGDMSLCNPDASRKCCERILHLTMCV
jgi:hypothetical protein